MDTAQALLFLGNSAKSQGDYESASRYAELVMTTAWPVRLRLFLNLNRAIISPAAIEGGCLVRWCFAVLCNFLCVE